MASSSSKSGFTLLEVLVALAILSVTLGALYQTFSASLSYQTTAGREAEAVTIAQSLLTRVGADVPANMGESSGDSGDGVAWRLTIAPADASVAISRPPPSCGRMTGIICVGATL